jgi:NADH-quinone oxidoreductase subunit C
MNLELLKVELEQIFPGAALEIIPNGSPSGQHSLLIDNAHAPAIALYLRDRASTRFDHCSNVTGVDWPLKTTTAKVKVKREIEGVEKEVEELETTESGNYLEAVYHLFSTTERVGPLVLRMRTANRGDARAENNRLPSLTPIWRAAEFQEREIFDLYGIHFDGHPDLRRLLMWDEYVDHPMRRDYNNPDPEEEAASLDAFMARRAAQGVA